MLNNVVLVGRLTRDPELKYTPNNQAVATFSLAVNRQFKNANGERDADFINCVIWRQQAENLANWARKGAQIGVVGRIQTRNYEDTSGKKVYVTEVVADSFQMLESRAEREANGGGQSQPQNQGGFGQQQQQRPQQTMQQPQQRVQQPQVAQNTGNNPLGGKPMEIADDDLPF